MPCRASVFQRVFGTLFTRRETIPNWDVYWGEGELFLHAGRYRMIWAPPWWKAKARSSISGTSIAPTKDDPSG
jgi:hypothetical protein